VLPPPVPEADVSVMFTTPYQLVRTGTGDWNAYLDRALGAESDRVAAFERFLKYGPTPTHWHDFILDGYAGNRQEVIFLAGIPDRPGSLPHSTQK